MANFWEILYTEKGALWDFYPSDSALIACGIFLKNEFKEVLIPGIGYGRNAKPFYDSKFEITGIEISEHATKIAKENGFDFLIHKGSLTEMPFDNKIYDCIFCYATLHLFNEAERIQILRNSYNQLRKGGLMFFNLVSIEAICDFKGERVNENVIKLKNGLEVTFYNLEMIEAEFKNYNIIEIAKIDEPIKHMKNQKPLKCYNVICKKI